MGACFQAHDLDAASLDEAVKEFAKLQRKMRRERGTDPYNGTLSNCDLTPLGSYKMTTFPSADAACQWLQDNTEKRQATIVKFVEAKDKDGFDIVHYMVGGWAPE